MLVLVQLGRPPTTIIFGTHGMIVSGRNAGEVPIVPDSVTVTRE